MKENYFHRLLFAILMCFVFEAARAQTDGTTNIQKPVSASKSGEPTSATFDGATGLLYTITAKDSSGKAIKSGEYTINETNSVTISITGAYTITNSYPNVFDGIMENEVVDENGNFKDLIGLDPIETAKGVDDVALVSTKSRLANGSILNILVTSSKHKYSLKAKSSGEIFPLSGEFEYKVLIKVKKNSSGDWEIIEGPKKPE